MAIQGMWVSCKDGELKGPGTGTERDAARAAPRVPEERANAVEELRPSELDVSFYYRFVSNVLRLGPEITRSISPG